MRHVLVRSSEYGVRSQNFGESGLDYGGCDLNKRITLVAILILSFTVINVGAAGELVRIVRLKISAGDLASAVAAVEDYKKQTGVDVEYLDAVGWLARGAEMMNKREQAAAFVVELRREIPQEKAELLAPFGAAIEVHRHLGPGLLESAYETALAHELTLRGMAVRRQVLLPVSYKGLSLDDGYRIDLLVEECVLVEVKAIAALAPIHESQLLTYLKFSDKRLGLLLNFHCPTMKDGTRRVVHRL